MVRFIFIFILVIITNWSCVTAFYKVKKQFDFCYDNQETKIQNLININGYYQIKIPFLKTVYDDDNIFTKHKSAKSVRDTNHTNLLFFEDGTFVQHFHDTNEDRRNNGTSSIELLFKEIYENPDGKAASSFKELWKWGIYKLNGDTIKVQWINHPPKFNIYWYGAEVWFKIIDRNTIIEVYSKSFHGSGSSSKKAAVQYAEFYPTEFLPSSDCWLKNKDWFWCKNRK